MPLEPRPFPPRALACAIAAIMVIGCQVGTPPSTQIGPAGSTVVAGPHGTVTVDLGHLRGLFRGRHLQSLNFAESAITQLRLRADGPGMTEVTGTTAWTNTAAAGATPTLPTGSISLTVPAGPNRLITLEGLDANGHVLAVMRGMATVADGSSQTLTLNANTDAAARVLADLLNPTAADATDKAGIGTTIGTTDICASLQKYVTSVTSYDATKNTYSGVEPLRFGDHLLADMLRTNGTACLTTAVPVTLQAAVGSTVTVTVTDGGTPVGASVSIYDPVTASCTAVNGMAVLSNVPPGTWAIATQYNGKTVFGTVTTRGGDTVSVSLDLSGTAVAGASPSPTPTPTPTPTPNPYTVAFAIPTFSPIPTPTAFPTASPRPFVDTLAGGRRTNFGAPASLLVNGTAVGQPPDHVAYDGAGTAYFMAGDQIFKQVATGLQRLAWSTAADASAPIAATDLRGFTVTSSAVVYATSSDGSVWSVTTPGTATKIGKVTNAGDIVYSPSNATLYLADGNLFCQMDPVSGTVTNLGALPNTAMGFVASSNGDVYCLAANSGQIYKSAGGLAPTLYAGVNDGAADGAAGVGTVCNPTGLAIDDSTAPATPKLYIADAGNNRIRVLDGSLNLTTLAGSTIGEPIDGALTGAHFDRPVSVAFNPTNKTLLVADRGNARVRTIDTTASTISTLVTCGDPLFAQGTASAARFQHLVDAAAKSDGTLFVLDSSNATYAGNSLIEQISTAGAAAIFAGTGQDLSMPSTANAVTAALGFNATRLVYSNSTSRLLVETTKGSPSVANSHLYSIDVATGALTDLTPTLGANLLYVIGGNQTGAIYGVTGDYLMGLDPTTGALSPFATGITGIGGTPSCVTASNAGRVFLASGSQVYYSDGSLPAVYGDTGLAAVTSMAYDDTTSTLFVTDGKVVEAMAQGYPGRTCTTLAGSTLATADADGPAATATFANSPQGLTVDASGNLYVVQSDRVRRIQR